MNKKILIPIAILLAMMLLFSVIIIAKNKKVKKVEIEAHQEDNVSSTQNEDTEEVTETQEDIDDEDKDIIESSLIDEDRILVFGDGDGEIKLYSLEGEILDFAELSKVDIGKYEKTFIKEKEKDEKETVETEDKNEYAYISTPDGMIKTTVKEDKIIIYDKDGKAINSISLDKKNEEAEMEAETETETEGLDELFTVIRTNKNELIFKDGKRNSLTKVEVVGNKIKTTLILKNMDLENLNNLYITEENLYLTFDEDTNIYQLSKKAAISPSSSRNMEVYDVGDVPNFSIFKDGFIYFATPDKIGRYDTSIEKDNILEIITGDRTSDIYIEDNFIFAINDFGKGKDNSVLMKIELETLKVKEIMELKGLNSKFVGTIEDLAYIRQKDSIKEVNLKTFKPITTRKRVEGVPVQVVGDTFYSLVDGEIKVTERKSNKTIDSFNAEGFSFHIISN